MNRILYIMKKNFFLNSYKNQYLQKLRKKNFTFNNSKVLSTEFSGIGPNVNHKKFEYMLSIYNNLTTNIINIIFSGFIIFKRMYAFFIVI